MVAAQVIEQAVQRVADRVSFIQDLLVGALEWPFPEAVEDLQDLAYGWTAEDLRAQGLDAHLLDGHVRNVRPLQALAAEARQLERRVAVLVNAVYGLTPEEVALMRRTAPPRLPGDAPAFPTRRRPRT